MTAEQEKQAYIYSAACGALFILLLVISWHYDKSATVKSPPRPVVAAPAPAPPKPPLTKAEIAKRKAEQRKALEVQRKAQAQALARAAACRELESRLVYAGHDVGVTLMSDNNTNMVIYGPGVNRLMVRQMATRSSGQQLKSIGFYKVTFMRDQYDWVGEWDVFYNTVRVE